jgi:hypothetical protein
MVAEVAPPIKRKHLPSVKGYNIPLATRLQVRNLYVGACLGPSDIAPKVGLTLRQVRRLVATDKLAPIRRRAVSNAIKVTDNTANHLLERFNQEIASQSEEASLGAIVRAREAVASKDKLAARDFQSWTGGIRNLVDVSRRVRGLDAKQPEGSVTMNLGFFMASPVETKPIEASQVVDCQAVSVSDPKP